MPVQDIENVIRRCGVIPVLKIKDAATAVPLASALIAGGLPMAEVTFRTPAALEAMRSMVEAHGDTLFVGAGTVLAPDQADAAMDAGARFIVTPGFNPRVVDHCLEHGYPVYPGVNAPSQVEQGLERGLRVLKFFPAEASGGTAMLRALGGPYPEVQFIPTGGVSADNLADYLTLRNVLACGGSWLAEGGLRDQEDFDEVATRCRAAVALILRLRQVCHLI